MSGVSREELASSLRDGAVSKPVFYFLCLSRVPGGRAGCKTWEKRLSNKQKKGNTFSDAHANRRHLNFHKRQKGRLSSSLLSTFS